MPGARFSRLPDGWFECRCGLAYPAGKACPKCGQRAYNATPSREAGRPGAGHPAGRGAPGKGRRTKAEADYAAWLDRRRAGGDITGYTEQVTFRLPDGARYRADFLVAYSDGKIEVHEVKGSHTGKHLAWSEAGVARFRAARALLPWMTFRLMVQHGDIFVEEMRDNRDNKEKSA